MLKKLASYVKEYKKYAILTPIFVILEVVVNGKIICRKMAKKNVVFPTYFLYHKFMI